jgi:CRISPR-associated protein Cas2
MNQSRFNAYRVMWLFVSFDLPVVTKAQKRIAANFRKKLLQDGFAMMQYSIYIRHCASRESTEVHIKRVKRLVPAKGHVSIMTITDKQFGNIINFWGKNTMPTQSAPPQIELF